MARKKKATTNEVHINKYEIMCAFFKTEEDDNIEMAKELNEMLNVFYQFEIQHQRNVMSLPFCVSAENKEAIEYIDSALATA